MYGPLIDSIKVIRSGKVRRAKLYYLRDRTGKSARIAEKIRKKIGIDVDVKPEPPPPVRRIGTRHTPSPTESSTARRHRGYVGRQTAPNTSAVAASA